MPTAWSVDPFGAELRDGRIWGRGAADMKAGLAAMLFATDAAVRKFAARGAFPGRIVLAALVDEEGMMAGAKHFVAAGHTDGVDGVICCEPEAGEICHVAKGALRLRIDLRGVMAHGAMPFQGRNPNRAVGAVIGALAELEAELQTRHGDHEHLGRPWITPTVLRAGDAVQMNVMPANASVWVDVRTVPAVDHAALLAAVDRRVGDVCAPLGIEHAVDVIDDRPAVEVAESDPLVRALWDAHAAVGVQPTPSGRCPGGHRRHRPHVPRRYPVGGVRPGRQVDRPPSRRVRRGGRPRRARPCVRRGGRALSRPRVCVSERSERTIDTVSGRSERTIGQRERAQRATIDTVSS